MEQQKDPLDIVSLPDKEIFEVLDTFTLVELFEFSLCSEQCREAASRFTLQDPEFWRKVHLIAELNRPFFVLHSDLGDDDEWLFFSERAPRSESLAIEQRRLDENTVMQVYKHHREDSTGLTFVGDPIELNVLKILKYLNDVLHCHPIVVHFKGDLIEDVKNLLEQESVQNAVQFYADQGSVSHEEMTMMLDMNTSVKTILVNPGRNYRYGRPINTERLTIGNAQWLGGEQLLMMNCRHLRLKEANLNNEDIRAFVDKWMENPGLQLEFLVIHYKEHNEHFGELDQTEIMKGIRTQPGRKKIYDPVDRGNRIGGYLYRKGLDFRRPSDGKRATLLVHHHRYARIERRAVFFVIWDEPDPDLRGDEANWPVPERLEMIGGMTPEESEEESEEKSEEGSEEEN